MVEFKKIPIFSTLSASDLEEVRPYLIRARLRSKFKKIGIVSEKGGRIVIRDLNKLKSLC